MTTIQIPEMYLGFNWTSRVLKRSKHCVLHSDDLRPCIYGSHVPQHHAEIESSGQERLDFFFLSIFVIPSLIPGNLQPHPFLEIIEAICIAWFTLEFIVR